MMILKNKISDTLKKQDIRKMKIIISDSVRKKCPNLCVGMVEADVKNTEKCKSLWEKIKQAEDDFKQTYTTESIKLRPSIAATRAAYRVLGKDPSRYRPSNEQLVRRILQEKELYQINTLVDINNLASIHWGYSIGGFDEDKITGDILTLGIGRAGESYEGIGRGSLNIEFLPVYRDAKGGIGTPTSDHERTKIGLDIHRLLFLINGYDGNRENILNCASELQDLLKQYAFSDGGSVQLIF